MIPFTKMHGIGNDFVMLDAITDAVPGNDLSGLAIRMCDRRFGVGADGLILIYRGNQAPFKMRMFNPDGSESEMCGNGIRCFANLLTVRGHIAGQEVDVETDAGVLHCSVSDDGQVTVNVGRANLARKAIGMIPDSDDPFIDQPLAGYRATAVSMGNPHAIIFVDDVAAIDLAKVGPGIEHNSHFANRINVHFAQVVDRRHLIQRTWERGAGITLACGTGACSVGVAGFLTGRSERKVRIDLPGGSLQIEYLESGEVMMTGPAKIVFEGSYDETLPEEELDLLGIGEAELLEHI